MMIKLHIYIAPITINGMRGDMRQCECDGGGGENGEGGGEMGNCQAFGLDGCRVKARFKIKKI